MWTGKKLDDYEINYDYVKYMCKNKWKDYYNIYWCSYVDMAHDMYIFLIDSDIKEKWDKTKSKWSTYQNIRIGYEIHRIKQNHRQRDRLLKENGPYLTYSSSSSVLKKNSIINNSTLYSILPDEIPNEDANEVYQLYLVDGFCGKWIKFKKRGWTRARYDHAIVVAKEYVSNMLGIPEIEEERNKYSSSFYEDGNGRRIVNRDEDNDK